MGVSSALGSSALLPAGLGFRNLLINGDMQVWQRGTTVKYNVGQGAYGPDRWCGSPLYQTSRTQRVSVSSPPQNLWSQYACRVSNPSTAEVSVSRLKISQKIESINAFPLRGRTVVLSFWIRFSASNFTATSGSYGNFVYGVGSFTSTTDSASNTTGPDVESTGTILAGSFPTSWTKYTLTCVLPTNINNVETLFGTFDAAGNTTADVNWYEITGVQLEANYQPTPFEQRPIGVELALCQRYYQRFNNDSATNTNPLNSGVMVGTSGLAAAGSFIHIMPMRKVITTADISYANINLDDQATFGTAVSSVSVQSSRGTFNNTALFVSTTSNVPSKSPNFICGSASSPSFIAISAEL